MREHGDRSGRPTRDEVAETRRVEFAVEVLGHLAEPTRLRLLRLLTVEQDVTTLTSQVSASRSSVSQHLNRLRLAGLVQVRRNGRRMMYSVSSDHLTALVDEVFDFADHAVHGIPHHYATSADYGDPPGLVAGDRPGSDAAG